MGVVCVNWDELRQERRMTFGGETVSFMDLRTDVRSGQNRPKVAYSGFRRVR